MPLGSSDPLSSSGSQLSTSTVYIGPSLAALPHLTYPHRSPLMVGLLCLPMARLFVPSRIYGATLLPFTPLAKVAGTIPPNHALGSSSSLALCKCYIVVVHVCCLHLVLHAYDRNHYTNPMAMKGNMVLGHRASSKKRYIFSPFILPHRGSF